MKFKNNTLNSRFSSIPRACFFYAERAQLSLFRTGTKLKHLFLNCSTEPVRSRSRQKCHNRQRHYLLASLLL